MSNRKQINGNFESLLNELGVEFSSLKSKNSNSLVDSVDLSVLPILERLHVDNIDDRFLEVMERHPLRPFINFIYVHLLISNDEAAAIVVNHFNSKHREYMEYYKNEFEDVIYIESLNPEQIIPIKIIECVVSYALSKDSTVETFLYDLIKKNNRSIYNQVKNVADSDSFIFNYANLVDKRITKLKTSEYLPFMMKAKNEIMAAYLFCLRYDLIHYTHGEESDAILDLAYNTLSEYDLALDEEQEMFQELYIKPNREKYSQLKKQHSIHITKPTLISEFMLKMLKLDIVEFDHSYFRLFVNLLNRSTHFDMNPRDLFQRAYITPEQIDIIVHQYHEIEQTIDETEINLQFKHYVVIQLTIITILNEYKSIKNAFTGYLEDSFEQLAQVYEDENKQQVENELNQQVKELQSENDMLQTRIKQMEVQLKESELHRKRLEKELELTQPKEELLHEVHALREYMHLHNHEAGIVAEVSGYDQALLLLKDKDILLVGGHTNMTNKLKEALPSIDIFNIDQLGKNQNLSKYEHVFIYWSFCNHAAYNKTITQISQSKGKLHYLSGSTNIELVTREMYRSITE